MGIDKGNVASVIHYDVTDALENYYQEAGRAGRNGKKAYAVLLYRQKELKDLSNQIEVRFPPISIIKEVYRSLVNYLQLPSESGEGLYFDFDLNDFCAKFNLNQATVVYALKVLQQEDIIAYSDSVFIPSKIVIIARRDELEIFYSAYTQFEPLIKTLLRSYDGIMDYQVIINEKRLEKSLSINEKIIREQLIELHNKSILQYQPPKELPQIQFLKNRVKAADLNINQNEVLKRKDAYKKRVDGIINYVLNIHECRSKQFAGYFDVPSHKDCQICDNCINSSSRIKNDNLFNEIASLFNDTSARQMISVEEILDKYNKNKTEVWKVLDFLIAEKRISIEQDGKIVPKKKGPR